MTLKEYAKEVGPLILALLFLVLLDPFLKGFLFGYLIIIVLFLLKKDRLFSQLDADSLFLLIFSISYTLFNALGENKGIQYLIIQVAFPPAFYLLGKMMVSLKITKTQIIYLLMTVGFIYSLSGVVSVILDLLKGGFVQTERVIANFWTGKGVLATGMSGYFIYNMTIPAIIIANRKRFNLFIKFLLLFFYVISMLCVFRLGSRTLIGLTAITLILTVLYVIVNQSFVKNLKFVFQLVVIVFLILKFAPLDLNADYLSTLGARLQDSNASSASSAGGRTGLWEEAFEKIFTHPLGWQSEHYSHNLWLDAAKVSGIIPLIFLLIFNIRNLANLKALTKLNNPDFALNTVFYLFTIATFIYFFVEPILEGNFFAFVVFCLIQGILKGYIVSGEPKINNKLMNS